MNNRTLSQSPFAEMTAPTYSQREIADLSDHYSTRTDIVSVANAIIQLLADMRRFLLATELDHNAPEFKPGKMRTTQYKTFIDEGGIAKMHQDACRIFNAAAKSLDNTMKLQKENAPSDIKEAVTYSKALIQHRLNELEEQHDLLHLCYKNTSTSENKLKQVLNTEPSPKPEF